MAGRVPSKQTFREHSEPVKVTIADNVFRALPKQFSTGSFGWYHSGKMLVDFSGELLTCQVSMSVVVVGSKDAPLIPSLSVHERDHEFAATSHQSDQDISATVSHVSVSCENERIVSNGPSIAQNARQDVKATPVPPRSSDDLDEVTEGPKTHARSRKGGKK